MSNADEEAVWTARDRIVEIIDDPAVTDPHQRIGRLIVETYDIERGWRYALSPEAQKKRLNMLLMRLKAYDRDTLGAIFESEIALAHSTFDLGPTFALMHIMGTIERFIERVDKQSPKPPAS